MKTVGNDLVRNQLHADRKWYLILGFVLIILVWCYLAHCHLPHFRLFFCLVF